MTSKRPVIIDVWMLLSLLHVIDTFSGHMQSHLLTPAFWLANTTWQTPTNLAGNYTSWDVATWHWTGRRSRQSLLLTMHCGGEWLAALRTILVLAAAAAADDDDDDIIDSSFDEVVTTATATMMLMVVCLSDDDDDDDDDDWWLMIDDWWLMMIDDWCLMMIHDWWWFMMMIHDDDSWWWWFMMMMIHDDDSWWFMMVMMMTLEMVCYCVETWQSEDGTQACTEFSRFALIGPTVFCGKFCQIPHLWKNHPNSAAHRTLVVMTKLKQGNSAAQGKYRGLAPNSVARGELWAFVINTGTDWYSNYQQKNGYVIVNAS